MNYSNDFMFKPNNHKRCSVQAHVEQVPNLTLGQRENSKAVSSVITTETKSEKTSRRKALELSTAEIKNIVLISLG